MKILIIFCLLGIIQGVAEFLPISSSGHLVIIENIPFVKNSLGTFGEEVNLLINVSLHVATLIAVVLFLRDEISSILKGLVSSIKEKNSSSPAVKKTVYIIIATIPAVVIGLIFKDYFNDLFSNQKSAFIMLILNGFLLIATKWIPVKNRQLEETGIARALLIGLFQALAIIPGISRSGMTIAGGLIMGLAPASAATFSFLMSVPVIAGAGILEGRKLFDGTYSQDIILPLILAMILTVVVAYFSIKLLFEMVKRIKLDLFGYYTIVLGIAGLIITGK
jgi:undecaprenyl-diphosphatase